MAKENIRIKDIAERAGVSVGTVDRVLHNRPNVSKAALEKVNAELIGLYEQSDTDILGLQQKMDHLVELLAALDAPESILDSCVIVGGVEETGGEAE